MGPIFVHFNKNIVDLILRIEWRDWCHQTEDEADRNAISRASFNSDQGLDSPYTYDQSQTPSQPSLVPVAHQQSSSKDDLDVLEVISQNSLSGVREVFAIQYSTPELCR